MLVRADEVVELPAKRVRRRIIEKAPEGRKVPEAEHGDERWLVAGGVHPGVDVHEALVREVPACALVAEPRLQVGQAAGEHVVDLNLIDEGCIGRRRWQILCGHRRCGGQHFGAAARGEALQVRHQIGELAERQIRIARHDRAPVGPDVRWPVDQHGVGGEDRLEEVLGGVMTPHARQLGARPRRRRERLTGHDESNPNSRRSTPSLRASDTDTARWPRTRC